MKKTLFLFIVTLCAYTTRIQAQIITTIVGTGFNSYTGDGGMATDATVNDPMGVASDANGNIYISDTKNNCIRKVDAAGIISTIAGTGVAGYSGDGGPATAAEFYHPSKIALDVAGNIYIVDNSNYCIRKINTSGIINTIIGNGTTGNTGDGGPASNAQINACAGLALDNAGNIYFADLDKHTIRRIDFHGIVTTVAGSGISGYAGDGGPATAAKLNDPFGIDIDGVGNLYIAEYNNNCIRKVSASGIISTLTKSITIGYTGDGAEAIYARLNRPVDVVADKGGNLFIADQNNSAIRKIDAYGIITTVVGTGTSGFSGDGGSAIAAKIHSPAGVTYDHSGNLIFVDYGNNRIRKVTNMAQVTQVITPRVVDIRLFPNPSSGDFILEVSPMPDGEKYTASITDLAGKQLLENSVTPGIQMPVHLDAPAGLYLLSISSSQGTVTQKISILK